MQATNFTITIVDLHWVKGDKDDPADLCAHGNIFVQIGQDVVCDADTIDVTVSAAALHLMRTLDRDYKPNDFSGQLLPCCGHFMVPSNDLQRVDLLGCANGVDWEVRHLDAGLIELTLANTTETTLSIIEYKQQVLAFADAVKAFYDASSAKIIPEDDFDSNGYTAFWNEWHMLRSRFSNT